MYRITYIEAENIQVSMWILTLNRNILLVKEIDQRRAVYQYNNYEGAFSLTKGSMYSVLDYSVLKEKQLWLWEQEHKEQEDFDNRI